jgi:transposase
MEPLLASNTTPWSFPFSEPDWAQTPPAVQGYLHTLRDEMAQLHERVERLEARLNQNSSTSSKPPSSDSPYQKPRRRTTSSRSRKGGGKPGHPGHRQVLLAPTTVADVLPESCACGSNEFRLIQPYYTHQELELPPIEMEVTHWVLYQGQCLGVRDHRVTTRGRRRSWRLASLAPLAFSSGAGLLSPV